METRQIDEVCDAVLNKVLSKEPISGSDKKHLAGCDRCMRSLVELLDEKTAAEKSDGVVRGEAVAVVARARESFARQFGIVLPQ